MKKLLLMLYASFIPDKWLIKWHNIKIGNKYVLREYADNPFERDNYTAFIGYIKGGYISYYYMQSTLGNKDRSCSIAKFVSTHKHTY